MGPLDAIWHLLNFFLPAAGVAAITAALAKLVWRTALRPVRWWLLARAGAAGGAGALLLGLVVFGRDGRMATYALLCAAVAGAIWWVGLRGRA